MVEQNIKVLRKTLGLSQAAFGEKLGVSRDVIGNIEYGRVKPKDVFLNHICAVFNVRGEWLRTGAGDVFDADERLSRGGQPVFQPESDAAEICASAAEGTFRGAAGRGR